MGATLPWNTDELNWSNRLWDPFLIPAPKIPFAPQNLKTASKMAQIGPNPTPAENTRLNMSGSGNIEEQPKMLGGDDEDKEIEDDGGREDDEREPKEKKRERESLKEPENRGKETGRGHESSFSLTRQAQTNRYDRRTFAASAKWVGRRIDQPLHGSAGKNEESTEHTQHAAGSMQHASNACSSICSQHQHGLILPTTLVTALPGQLGRS
eukprot:COSAG01_NODE_6534_length_3616_cov_19.109468_5_plen_210_part_00